MTIFLHEGDCRQVLQTLPDQSVHAVITSPPYFRQRDYRVDGQVGLEHTPAAFAAALVHVFREVRRVLRDDGTLWLNLGDTYSRTGGTDRKVSATARVGSSRRTMDQMPDRTSKAPPGLVDKQLIGVPWRVAFALQDEGWILRSDVIWHKPNAKPESVKDRPIVAHEHLFMFSKRKRYSLNMDALRSEGAVRSVRSVNTTPYRGAHFATYPTQLIEPYVLAAAPPRGVVLDPFAGAGTTGVAAQKHGRDAILIELNPDYCAMIRERLQC